MAAGSGPLFRSSVSGSSHRFQSHDHHKMGIGIR